MRPTPALVALVTLIALAAACRDGAPLEPRLPQRASLAADPATHETFPVDFTLPAGYCGLTTNVHLTGEFEQVTHIVETPSGGVRGVFNQSARGTAVGDDGSRYRFSYNNHSMEDDTSFPITFKQQDVFVLIGQQGAPNINARFVLDGSVDANNTVTVDIKLAKGDPFNCDPI